MSRQQFSEAQTRYNLIDPAIKKAGWNLADRTQIWFEVPVQGYDAILDSMGTNNSPGWLGKGAVQFSEGQLIQLQCRNVSVIVNQQVLTGMLRGTFFPLEQKGERAWS